MPQVTAGPVQQGAPYRMPKAPTTQVYQPAFMGNSVTGADVNPQNTQGQQQQAIAAGNNASQDYQAQLGLLGNNYSADQQCAASQYGADQQFAQTRYTTDATQNQFNQRLQFARDRYNQLFPMVQSQYNSLGQGSQQGGYGQPPTIDTGGVYSPQQIQEQVNSVQAQNEQKGASALRQSQRSLGGRGFGTNSPLLAQIQSNLAIGTQAANAQAAQQIPFTAAQANASQRLASQQAAASQYNDLQNQGIQRDQNSITRMSALLNALTQMMNINV